MFKTNRGLLQNLSFCRRRKRENKINPNAAINDNNNIAAVNDKSDSQALTETGIMKPTSGTMSVETVFVKDLTNAYKKISHWKQNLFMMPIGAPREKYIE